MTWTTTEWDAYAALLAEGWPGEFTDAASSAYRVLLDGVPPQQAAEALRRLLHEGHRFRPSASELLAAARHDPSQPTWAEAYQLIYGRGGVLGARPTVSPWGSEGERRRLCDAAAAARSARMHPLIGGFCRAQGLSYLRSLSVDCPDWGTKHRRDLERAWDAYVAAADGRQVAALAAGTGRAGLRRLDPLGALGRPAGELPRGSEEPSS